MKVTDEMIEEFVKETELLAKATTMYHKKWNCLIDVPNSDVTPEQKRRLLNAILNLYDDVVTLDDE